MTWIEWYNALHRVTARMAVRNVELTDADFEEIAKELRRIAHEIERRK